MTNNNRFQFRAWDTTDNTMYQDIGITQCGVEVYENQTDFPPKVILNRGKDCFIIMQWTGLTDKNGVKIFEGDLVTTSSSKLLNTHQLNRHPIFEVFWRKAAFHYRSNGKDDAGLIQTLDEYADIEVIGNIYEKQ